MSELNPERPFNTVPQINALDLCVIEVPGEGQTLVSLTHRVLLVDDMSGASTVNGQHKFVSITSEVEDEINGEEDAGFPGWPAIFDWIEAHPEKVGLEGNGVDMTLPDPDADGVIHLAPIEFPAVWLELVVLGFEDHPRHGMILDRMGDETAGFTKVTSGPAPDIADGHAYYDDYREVEAQRGPFKIVVSLGSGQVNHWADFNVFDYMTDSLVYESPETTDEFPDELKFEVEGQKYVVPLKTV